MTLINNALDIIEAASTITIINDMGTTVYAFHIVPGNSMMSMSVKIVLSLVGILLLVGVAGISIFVISQKMQDCNEVAPESDTELSSSLHVEGEDDAEGE